MTKSFRYAVTTFLLFSIACVHVQSALALNSLEAQQPMVESIQDKAIYKPHTIPVISHAKLIIFKQKAR